MKLIHLKSLPLPVWVVELPEDNSCPVRGLPTIIPNEGLSKNFIKYPDKTGESFVPTSLCNLYCIGCVSDLTEQQFGDLVHSLPAIFYNRRAFRDYKRDHKFPCDTYLLDRAEKSFISAIEAEGYVTELTECDNEWCENGYIDEGWGNYSRCIKCLDIENMEEKVIDISRCYVFTLK